MFETLVGDYRCEEHPERGVRVGPIALQCQDCMLIMCTPCSEKHSCALKTPVNEPKRECVDIAHPKEGD